MDPIIAGTLGGLIAAAATALGAVPALIGKSLSQRMTDVCFAALSAAAASIGVHNLPIPACGQGTMNNVTLGAPGWSFYETLGGGQGGSARGDGPDAVHVGMSNTRNTPVESLERAYPLRVVEYSVRRGSGGAGASRGGDGIV